MYIGSPFQLSIIFAVYLSSFGTLSTEPIKNAIYKKCKADPTKPEEKCAEDLTCTDLNGLASYLGQRCTLKDPKPVDTATCRPKVQGYSLWVKQSASPKPTQTKGQPKAGWKKAGCYLEKGEICSMSAHGYAGAEPHEICKLDHGCQLIKDDWGFCRYNSSPALHALPIFFYLSCLSLIVS